MLGSGGKLGGGQLDVIDRDDGKVDDLDNSHQLLAVGSSRELLAIANDDLGKGGRAGSGGSTGGGGGGFSHPAR